MMKKFIWNIDNIREGLQKFHVQYGHYPTATEIDACAYLPAARTIERRFGGLVALRGDLKLDSQTDLRTGEHSSRRAYKINKRAHKVEGDVFEYLQRRFGVEFVHREYFFTDDRRTRADFFVFDTQKGFCVDVFYASDLRNVTGCLNSKLDKYQSDYMRQYPIIYLQMNSEFEQESLDRLVSNKKRKIPTGQHLMSWKSFEQFCANRKPLRVS